MHIDKEDFGVYTFLKFGIALVIFFVLPFIHAILTLIFVAITYRSVVAKIYGLHVMPVMDLNCFYSNDKAITN